MNQDRIGNGVHLSERRAERIEMVKHSAIIRLKYFLRIKNVGDRITPDLLDTLFGLRTIYYPGGEEPHLVATGSIISGATAHSHVWGAGLMFPQNGIGSAATEHIYAVRGKLTLAALREAGVTVGDIPLGDPAYLIRHTALHRQRPKKYRLGVVPHYVDRRDSRIMRLLQEDGVADLNVHADPDEFLELMAHCETIASSSLHGLIFAEALGIPNLWLHLSDRVVGGGFKFRDWFSMTARPQTLPFSPSEDDCASEYVKRADLHDCTIDSSALIAAFPQAQLAALAAQPAPGHSFVSLKQCRKFSPIPIFIISYNRGEYLLRVINSYLRLRPYVQIVIHDNGSDDALTLRILSSFEQSQSIRMVRASQKISHPDELNEVNRTVQDFFSDWAEPSRYVVTDCDVDMSGANGDALQVYGELLDQFRDAECVGPMLTIRDIAIDYPLYNEVLNRHIEQFWNQQPEWCSLSVGKVGCLRALIDTTFALHRAGEPFRRLKNGLRVYYPYEARHLDWYDRVTNSVYALGAAPAISHWSSSAFIDQHQHAPLRFECFTHVEADETGRLVAKSARTRLSVTHAVVVRFAYPESYPRDKLEWRFSYFRSMVLPRLLSQRNQRFVIAVRTAVEFAQRFRELSERIVTFCVKPGFENWIPSGYDPREFAEKRERHHVDFVPWEAIDGLEQYDIQTSVDSDDLILRNDFIDRIEQECWRRPDESAHVQFQPCLFDVQSLAFYESRGQYNSENGSPVYSIYQPKKSEFVYVGQDSHLRIGKLTRRSVVVDLGYVAMSTHSSNASTHLHRDAKRVKLPHAQIAASVSTRA
jgi:glycosyltransferase involved in cell wall biosynthesis